jgi:VanZ family protein
MLRLYLRRYALALLVAVVIVLLSLLPMPDMKVGVEVPLADKWTHMVMYGVLTLVIWFEYRRSHKQWDIGKLLLFAFLAPIAMGGALELMQAHLTTCRSGEWLDFVANTIGVCLGTVGGLLMKLSAKRQS